MMKIPLHIIFLLLFFASSLSVFGQDGDKDKIIRNKKIKFFTEKIGLTQEEADDFWPIYTEYWHKKNKLTDSRKERIAEFIENEDKLTNKQIEKYTDLYINYELKIALLLKEYHEKFKEILPPDKVMKIYVADHQFKIYLLKQIRNKEEKQ